jgi:F0F1-type ATP synthase assembly protein I
MDPQAKKMWAIVGSTGSVGLEISFAIGIGYFAGRYLDGKLGTAPWLAWIGFAAGVGAGVKALIRVVRTYQKSLENDQDDELKTP